MILDEDKKLETEEPTGLPENLKKLAASFVHHAKHIKSTANVSKICEDARKKLQDVKEDSGDYVRKI